VTINDTKLLRAVDPGLFLATTSAIIEVEKCSAGEAVTGCQDAQTSLGKGIIDEPLDIVIKARGEGHDLDDPAGR
jgi:hypothetical protein